MKIVWSNPSSEDLQNIKDYISHDSEYYANTFIMKILDVVENIADFPYMGRMVTEYENAAI